MLTVHLSTALDTTLAWLFYLLLIALLATIIAGALAGRQALRPQKLRGQEARIKKTAQATRKAGREKKLAK